MRYCGREFSGKAIDWIRQLIADDPTIHRLGISRTFCQTFHWLKADGGLKDMSCRGALLKMERDGHFILPPPRRRPYQTVQTRPQNAFYSSSAGNERKGRSTRSQAGSRR